MGRRECRRRLRTGELPTDRRTRTVGEPLHTFGEDDGPDDGDDERRRAADPPVPRTEHRCCDDSKCDDSGRSENRRVSVSEIDDPVDLVAPHEPDDDPIVRKWSCDDRRSDGDDDERAGGGDRTDDRRSTLHRCLDQLVFRTRPGSIHRRNRLSDRQLCHRRIGTRAVGRNRPRRTADRTSVGSVADHVEWVGLTRGHMDRIETVAGHTGADQLGAVLTHEHVFVVQEDFRLNYLRDWDEDAEVENAIATLNRLKAAGIDTIMDVSVLGIGRNIERIARVAERVDVNIVAATGYFTFNDLPFQMHYTGPALGFDVPEPLDDLFLRDITDGIGSTSIKAGFLVCVIEAEGLTVGVERVMRSVGRVAAQTGLPVVVHTNPHTQSGLIAQRVLAEEGVDLTRVILAHSGDSTDLDYLMRVADAGSVLGMDRFGVDVLLPHADRIDTVLALIDRGYGDRMVLSQDAFCYSDWFDRRSLDSLATEWNYFQVTGKVLPDLRGHGVSESVISTMLHDVPARLLCPSGVGQMDRFRLIGEETGLSPEKRA